MKKWLRRLRGALGMGITWAIAWAPLGAVTGGVTAAILGFPIGTVAANYAGMFGALGFLGGTIFTSLLGIAEGGRSFGQLSLPRFIVWGATGGLLLGGLSVGIGLLGAGLTTLGAVMAAAATLLGAGSAAATLAIARAAPDQALPRGDGSDSMAGGEGRSLPGRAPRSRP